MAKGLSGSRLFIEIDLFQTQTALYSVHTPADYFYSILSFKKTN